MNAETTNARSGVAALRLGEGGCYRGFRGAGGFTLLEVMLSMAIMAVIMAAVGAAMHGSLTAYAENRKIAQVTQTARVVLNRMMQEARTADAITSTSTSVSIVPPPNGDGISNITYQLTNGVLYYRRTVNGDVQSEPVVGGGDGVTIGHFTVWRETAVDGEGVQYTTRLMARLDISVDANSLDVSASVCPRRNLTF